MSKAEALIEAITQDIIGFLIDDYNLELDAAMELFYNSIFYDKIYDEETGLYLEGSAYIYELLKDSLTGGEPFDYTSWRETLNNENISLRELSLQAMRSVQQSN